MAKVFTAHLNELASLAKLLTVCLRNKCLWIRIRIPIVAVTYTTGCLLDYGYIKNHYKFIHSTSQ